MARPETSAVLTVLTSRTRRMLVRVTATGAVPIELVTVLPVPTLTLVAAVLTKPSLGDLGAGHQTC